MIAEWMLYSALCAVGLFAAASLVERWLLGAGTQVRHVWTVALLLSLAIPLATYAFAPRTTISIPSAPATPLRADELSALANAQASPADAPAAAPVRDQSLRKLIPTDRMSVTAWMALSAALAAYFVAGLIALVRMRRHWRPSDVCGVKVLVSERTGPAVVNPFSPQIVMPKWALAMDRYQLGLMIRHEQEHRRAGDPQLLALAQVAIIAMPWNPALWWGVMRLGMAVELDCDARVLRTADPRTYGDLLLEVARPRRGPRLVAAAAFAERAGGLERRIRAIARRRDRVSRGARAGAAIVGLVVVGIAWVAPHPSLPVRVAIMPSSGVSSSAAAIGSPRSDHTKPTEPLQVAPKTPDVLETRPAPRRGPVMPPPVKSTDAVIVGIPRRAFSQLDSLIYDRLFAGLKLSSDQETAARLFLSSLAALQVQQDRSMVPRNVQSTVARLRLTQERDSALLVLFADDADRALLTSRLAAMQGGGIGGGRRGRSSNPSGTDVPAGMSVGGPRSGGRGRVGGGDTSQQAAQISNVIDDVVFGLLFNGISLSAEQDASARSILSSYRQKITATIPDPLPFQLRLQGTDNVVMRPESRAALLAILSNDADRDAVSSRIVVEVRVVNRQPPAPPAH